MVYLNAYQIMFIVLLHFIGDFVLQSNWMALNKSRNNWALLSHVLTYTSVITIGGCVLWYKVPFDINLIVAWVLANGLLHFITDYITSRINARLWKLDNKAWFFTIIGFDQVIHYACLFFTSSWIYYNQSFYFNIFK